MSENTFILKLQKIYLKICRFILSVAICTLGVILTAGLYSFLYLKYACPENAFCDPTLEAKIIFQYIWKSTLIFSAISIPVILFLVRTGKLAKVWLFDFIVSLFMIVLINGLIQPSLTTDVADDMDTAELNDSTS